MAPTFLSNRFVFLAAALVMSIPAAHAQDVRRATITGRGGSGKCTIEVVVDAVADVEVQGDTARLHTLQGQRAEWRRFECNQPIPRNPGGFRFHGVDGRGHAALIGDPRSNGVAVVRIEDPQSGREGYTFDLLWNNGDGDSYSDVDGGYRWQDRDGDRPTSGIRRDALVDACGQAVVFRLRQNGYRDIKIARANLEDKPGHNDWIYGTTIARIGSVTDSFDFSCAVDLDSGRIRSVNVNPRAGGGYYGRDRDRDGRNSFTKDQAIRACAEAVQDRLRHDGYRDIKVTGIDADDRPGRSDWIVGDMVGRHGSGPENFDFACSADFDSGRIRSINVDRH